MDESDRAVRNATYQLFVDLGRAPTVREAAAAASRSEASLLAAWARLHDERALVLFPDGQHLRMANPFSAVPTAYRVLADDRWWDGNCAWDAIGICAALRTDGRIETTCADCGDPISLEIRGRRPADERLVFHCAVQARHWWDDIAFT